MKTTVLTFRFFCALLLVFISRQAEAQCSIVSMGDTTICGGSSVDLSTTVVINGNGPIVYDWSPALGLSCTACPNPVATPLATTEYTLTITDDDGCSTSETISVTIAPDPVAGFDFLPDNVCANTPIQFSSTSTGTGLTYSWNFGNPASGGQNASTNANPSHEFVATGTGSQTFDVTLTVTNSFGCQDAIIQVVSIDQIPDPVLIDPIAEFRNCDGSDFDLTVYDNSPVTGVNHEIIWGDGSPNYVSGAPPSGGTSHLYTTSDIFDLYYTITGANGCTSTAHYLVSNITNPAIGAANPGATTGCGPIELCFPLSSYAGNHPSTIYIVDYGDGSPTQQFAHPPPAIICHIYTESSCGQPGNAFTFNIQAENECDISIASISPIRVYTGPEAEFDLPDPNYCVNTPVTFENLSLMGFNSACATTTLFEWDFGDGTTQTTFTLADVSHVYTSPGTYTITLDATNNCSTSQHSEVVCIEEPPVPDFTLDPDTACVPFVAATTNLSTYLNTCLVDTLWDVTFIQSDCVPGTGNWDFESGSNNSSENPSFSFNNPGEYNVNLSLTNSCGTFFHEQIVLGQAPPEVVLTALPDVCEGTSVTPVATVDDCYAPADSYAWTFNGGDPINSNQLDPGSVLYENEGSYTVDFSVTNICGTTDATTPITVFPPPIADAGPDVSFCSSETAGLGAAPEIGVTYSWSPATGLSNGAISNPTVTLTNATTTSVDHVYILTASTSVDCFTTDTVVVTVHPIPVLIVNSPTICFGENVQLNVSGAGVGGSYDWSPITDLSCSDCENPIANPPITTVYTITGTSAEGCVNTTTSTVTVNPLPVVDAGPDLTLCDQPIPVNLNGTPAGGTWSGSPNVTVGGTFTPNGVESSTLTYSYTDPGTGCSMSDVMDVVVDPVTIPTVGPLDSICIGNPSTDLSTIFNPNPAGGVWTGPGVTNPNFNPVTAGLGTHTLTYTLGTGTCESPVTTEITVNPQPVIVTNDATICFGDDVQLNVSGAGVEGSYDWLPATDLSCTDCDDPIANPGSTIVYTITGTTAQGCSTDATSTVTVNPLPIVEAGPDLDLCDQPVPVNLNGTPAGGTWSGSPNVTAGGVFTPNGTETATLVYDYTDPGTGCFASDFMEVNVNPAITPAISPLDSICIAAGPSDLTAIFTPNPTGGVWSGTGVTNPNFDPATAGLGTHTLTYTLGTGTCETNVTTDIIVNPQPVIVTNDATICFGQDVQLNASGAGVGGSYDWLPPTDLSCTDCEDPIASPTTTTVYTVTGTTAQGCSSDATSTVTVNPLPIVDAGPDTTICNLPAPVQLGATPAGGVWSGPNISPTGEFTPAGIGDFTVMYTVTLGTGCIDSSSRIVTVLDPTPSDAGPDLEACIGSAPVDLNGAPAGGEWTGSFVTVGGTFTPSTSGVFELVYTTGVGNCLTRDTMEFTVHDLPLVDAGLDEVLCISEGAFDLVGNPLGGVWSGNGIVDANQGTFDPVVAIVGNHTITYTITDPITSCVNLDDLEVTVNPLPVVDFTVDPIICINTVVDFTNNSTLAAQNDWNFGDGNTSNQFAPSHTYTSTGVFDVTLVVTTVNGCVDSASTTVDVLDFPVAQFSVTPDTACGPLTASFTNNSTGIATTFQWDFGDGTSSSDENPADVVYNQAVYTDTNYIIVLEVSNYCGTDTHIDTITVLPSPTAIIGTDFNSGCTPWDVTIANASIGYPESYQWDFGDGTTSTISDTLFQHTYTTGQTPTDYTIQLIATNGCGSDTTEYTVTALPNDVDAFFNTSTVEGCAPVMVDFTQYTLGGTSYSWDFDDGNFSNVYSPTHTFVNPGTYNVSLFANDGCGFDTTMVTITVHPYPDMSFTSTPNSVCVFEAFDFTNQSTGITGVTWDFGDGNTSSLVNPSHAYALPGTYTVTLTGTSSAFGCVASFSQDVTVVPPPLAQFTVDPTNACIPLIVQTTNTSVDAVFYYWDFGDGNSSNQINPNHTYAVAGTYTIQLIVEGANGCTDTMATNVTAHPFPVADFDLASPLNCIPDGQAAFINQSSGAIGYEWDFGNGQTSVLTNPSTTYPAAGNYTVTLTVTNQYGCEDVAQQELTFYNYAEADYAIPLFGTCEGNSLSFNSTSLNANSVMAFWKFRITCW